MQWSGSAWSTSSMVVAEVWQSRHRGSTDWFTGVTSVCPGRRCGRPPPSPVVTAPPRSETIHSDAPCGPVAALSADASGGLSAEACAALIVSKWGSGKTEKQRSEMISLKIIVSATSSEALLDYVGQMDERGFNIVWNTILVCIALSFLNCISAIRHSACVPWLMLHEKLQLFLETSHIQYLTRHLRSTMGNAFKQGTLGVAFGVLTCLLINHLRLTSQPSRQRWIEVLSRPIATKTKSNWRVASGGQCKQSRCINTGISLSSAEGHAVAVAHTFTGDR